MFNLGDDDLCTTEEVYSESIGMEHSTSFQEVGLMLPDKGLDVQVVERTSWKRFPCPASLCLVPPAQSITAAGKGSAQRYIAKQRVSQRLSENNKASVIDRGALLSKSNEVGTVILVHTLARRPLVAWTAY